MTPSHPFFDGLRPSLHISHRGGSALAPENTLTAFEQAFRVYRTDMLEVDLQLSSDGVLMVAHDDQLGRCTDGHGDLSSFTREELQSLDAGYHFSPDGGRTFPFRGKGVRIPTLRETLEAFPSLRMNIELKRDVPGVESVLASELHRAGALHRVCIGSVHDTLAGRLQRLLPDAVHFYPELALTEFVMTVRAGRDPAGDSPFRVLDMPLELMGVRLVDERLVDVVRRLGRWVNVWTVDDPADMRQLIDLGVGGVMTDRPDLLRRVIDEAT